MKVYVRVYPFAVQEAEIDVPDGLSEDEVHQHLVEHFDEIDLGEPELDYTGADFEFECEGGCEGGNR